MKTRNLAWISICSLLLGIGCVLTSWSSPQGAPNGTIPVSTVVSVEAKYGKEIPEVQREDVRAFLNGKSVTVADWVPLRADRAGLELFVLIDESINRDVSLQFDVLRHFMNAQPPTTSFAVGYMRNGSVEIVQNFTADHALAGKALRIPAGSGFWMSSPYLAVSDLVKRWPESPNRHEILMISSGIDELQPGPNDTNVEEAVARTQRAGVQVYAMYAPGTGHSAHSMFRINWGQNNLAQLAEETGGESYVQGFLPAVSYSPYLDQFAERLRHQYRLTIFAMPGNKPDYQRIKVQTEVQNAELVTATRVYVSAGK